MSILKEIIKYIMKQKGLSGKEATKEVQNIKAKGVSLRANQAKAGDKPMTKKDAESMFADSIKSTGSVPGTSKERLQVIADDYMKEHGGEIPKAKMDAEKKIDLMKSRGKFSKMLKRKKNIPGQNQKAMKMLSQDQFNKIKKLEGQLGQLR